MRALRWVFDMFKSQRNKDDDTQLKLKVAKQQADIRARLKALDKVVEVKAHTKYVGGPIERLH